MAINQAYPSIDGVVPSWADIQANALLNDGTAKINLPDIAAIKSGRSVDLGVMKGASGGRVMARTGGEEKSEASITFYLGGWVAFQRELAKYAPLRGNQALIRYVHFDLLVEWTPEGSVEIFRRKMKGCCVIGDAVDSAEGTDAQVSEVPLSTVQVVNIIDGREIALI